MKITPTTKEAYRLFHEGSLALAEAEFNGILIDREYLEIRMRNLSRQIANMKEKLLSTDMGRLWKTREGEKISLTSDAQLRGVLFESMGIKPSKFTSGGKSKKKLAAVDSDVLEKMDNSDVKLLLKLRNALKMESTYLKNIYQESEPDGYVHPFFHLAGYSDEHEGGARSFRGSSSHINFQNQPNRKVQDRKLIRRAFLTRPGRRIMGWDYGGVEVCVSACNHQDPNMIRYIEHGDDMHRDCASMCFILPPEVCTKKYGEEGKQIRQSGKNAFVFPQFYFQEPSNTATGLWSQMIDLPLRMPTDPDKTVQEHLKDKKIRNYDAFEKHIEKVCKEFWEVMFPGYGKWRVDWMAKYEKKGYFDMLTGFRIEGIMSKYQLGNYPIQGPAFHCLLWSFTRVYELWKKESWKSLLIGQIHDELLADVVEEETEKSEIAVPKIMVEDIRKEWDWVIVPMTAEGDKTPVDSNWYEKK